MGAIIDATCCAGENSGEDRKALLSRNVSPPPVQSVDEYEMKCIELVKKMSSINAPEPIEHSKEQNSWIYISQIAQVCQDSVDEFLEKLVNALNKFQSDNKHNAPPQILKATLKDEDEAKQEVATIYNGNWHRVIDCCSASVIFDDYKQLYLILLILAKYNHNVCGFEVKSIKLMEEDNKPNGVLLLIDPVQSTKNEKVISIDLENICTVNEQITLDALKMNIAPPDEDDEEEEEEEEFLNLPAHIITIKLAKRE